MHSLFNFYSNDDNIVKNYLVNGYAYYFSYLKYSSGGKIPILSIIRGSDFVRTLLPPNCSNAYLNIRIFF